MCAHRCGHLAAALDVSEPLTAQLLSNFSADKLELLPDSEVPYIHAMHMPCT